MGGYRVLLDGYNLIKQHARWKTYALEKARNQLIAAAAEVKWPITVSQVTAVFDGPTATSSSSLGIAIRFALSADAYIQGAVRRSKQTEHLIVISDDREILHTAKVHGVRTHSCAWFYNRTLAAPVVKAGRKGLSPGKARAITEELKRYWLDA